MKTILADRPIKTPSEDSLNRTAFSNTIADYLLSPSSNDGLVVSINGKWGSGKTSIANLIKEKIREERFSPSNDILPVIVDYSPWNACEQNQIINQFLDVLSNHFVYRVVLKTLRKMLKITSFVSSLFPFPYGFKDGVKAVEKAFTKYTEALLSNGSNLEEFKEKVESYLKKTKLRYLVFIDDLDRLNNSEIRLLIQLIKSVCNFSNITYILMCDKDIVSNALADEQGIDGDEYLEKIVQLEFNVPLTKKEKIIDMLDSDLKSVIGEEANPEWYERIRQYCAYGMFSAFDSIREEKRFVNNLRFVIDVFGKEIDVPDLVAITYLRSVDEKVYRILLNYQDFLFGRNIPFGIDDDIQKAKKKFLEELSGTRINYEEHKHLMTELFPNMFSKVPEHREGGYLAGRLFVEKNFHKYMNNDYDYDDVSLERVNNLLELHDPELLLAFSKELNPRQGRTFLTVLAKYCKNSKSKEVFSSILTFLFKGLSGFPFPTDMFLGHKSIQFSSIVSSLLTNLESHGEKMLLEAAMKGEDVGALVYLSSDLLYSKGKGDAFSKVSDNTKTRIIDKTCDKAIEAIKNDLEDDLLDFGSIIRFALAHSKEQIKRLVSKKGDDWVAIFLSKSVSVTKSYSDGVYHHYSYDLEMLKEVLAVDEAKVGELIEKTANNKNKQRLIALKMQLAGVTPAEEHAIGLIYSVSDIQDYCNENKIDFVASEDYEKD